MLTTRKIRIEEFRPQLLLQKDCAALAFDWSFCRLQVQLVWVWSECQIQTGLNDLLGTQLVGTVRGRDGDFGKWGPAREGRFTGGVNLT